MKKCLLSSVAILLLAGCASAPSDTQGSALAGEWICHSIPTKDRLTFDRLDHFVLKSDGSGALRGISSIEMDKETTIRYLTKGNVKWQNKNDVLSFDFIDRSMVPAHSKNAAKAIKQNKTLQQQEKEQLDDFYCKCNDHVQLSLNRMAIS